MEKYLDETIHPSSTGWSTLITVYYLHKCDNDGTGQSWMDFVDHTRFFFVSFDYLKFDLDGELTIFQILHSLPDIYSLYNISM